VKIYPVGAETFHAEGRKERHTQNMTKLIVAFRKFANAPNKLLIMYTSPS